MIYIIIFNSLLPNYYSLEIKDDGVGFETANKNDGHYGLENITYRAQEINATLTIKSEINAGTKVLLQKKKK